MGFNPARGVSRDRVNARSPGKGAPRGSQPALRSRQALVQGLPRPAVLWAGAAGSAAWGGGQRPPWAGGWASLPAAARPCQARRVAGNAGRCRGLGRSSAGRGQARGAARGPRTRARAGLSAQSLPPAGRKGRRRGGARLPGRRGRRAPAGRRGGPSRSADTGKGNQGGLSAAKYAAPSGAKQGSRGREESRV